MRRIQNAFGNFGKSPVATKVNDPSITLFVDQTTHARDGRAAWFSWHKLMANAIGIK